VGINVSEAAKQVEGSRAEMTQIMEGTPAAGSGIKPGDISLAGWTKKSHGRKTSWMPRSSSTAGDTVPITVDARK